MRRPTLSECDAKCTKFLPWTIYISFLSGALLVSIYIASLVLDAQIKSRVFKTESEKVEFELKDGTVLVGTITSPTDSKRKYPTILHFDLSYQDAKRFNSSYKTSTYFAKKGIVFVHVGIRGHIESGGLPEIDIFSERNVMDAMEVIEDVRKRWFCDGNIGVFGHGLSGGLAAKLATESSYRIRAILLLNPIFDPCHIEGFSTFGTHEPLNKIIPTFFGSVVSQLSKNEITENEVASIARGLLNHQTIMENCFSKSIRSEFQSTNLLDSLSCEKIYCPVYIIQGMYDISIEDTARFYLKVQEHFDSLHSRYKESPTDKIFEKVNIDSLKIKVIVGPFGQDWIDDYDDFVLKFDSRLDTIDFVKAEIAHYPVYVIEPDLTVFGRIKQSSSNENLGGFWNYVQWPTHPIKYCLSRAGDAGPISLSPYSNCTFGNSEEIVPLETSEDNLTLNNYWRYDEDTSYLQCPLTHRSITLIADRNIELQGGVHVNLNVYIPDSDILSSVTILLEHVDENGQVGLIASKTVNGFSLKENTKTHSEYRIKTLVADLGFSTWHIRARQQIRITFLAQSANLSININDPDNFIAIPDVTGRAKSPRKVMYTSAKPPTYNSPSQISFGSNDTLSQNVRTITVESKVPINSGTLEYTYTININPAKKCKNFTATILAPSFDGRNTIRVSGNGTIDAAKQQSLQVNVERRITYGTAGSTLPSFDESKTFAYQAS